MIEASAELAGILAEGGFERRYVADLTVDGDRVLEDIPLTAARLTSRASARVRTQADATLVYSDDVGSSIIPTDISSWLTPVATFMTVSMRISVGGFSEKVLRGELKLTGASDVTSQRAIVAGRAITVNSRIKLTMADAFTTTDQEDFPVPGGPLSLDSAWAEIGRVSGLPLLRNVTDAAIPREVVYEKNRLDAIFALGLVLGGVPYVNPAGQVTIDPDEWGDPTTPLMMGADGTVVQVQPESLSDLDLYNEVVVLSFDTSQDVVLARARVSEGPMRYGGPFGRRSKTVRSQLITTQVQAQDYADSLLPQVSTVAALPYLISCLPDPRREVGDVVPFTTQDGRELMGRITELTLPDDSLMTVKVMVDQ